MKKITATMLLMAMLLSTVACSHTETNETTADTSSITNTADTTVTEPDEETRAMHQVPDTLDFGGEDFLINSFVWSTYAYYYFADEATGDAMNDAIFNRTIRVEDYLNVDICQELESVENHLLSSQKVKSTVLAGDDVYSLNLLHVIRDIAELASMGMLYNLDDLPYVDMEADWWKREQMDMLRLGKNTYYGVSDYMIPAPFVFYFNKEMVENHNLDNPYDLVYDGKWTLDTVVDMAISVTQDVNGDGQYTKEDDICGISTNEIAKYISFMTGCDQFITDRDSNNRIRLALNNEKTISIIESIYKMVENKGTLYIPSSANDADTFHISTGRILFYLHSISYAETLRDCEIDIGILPYPKYDEAQENYISQDWSGLMSVPNSIRNPEKVGAVLELLSWESANEVIPAFYEVTLSGKLARDEDSKNMLDILFDTISYEIGGNYFGLSSGFNELFYTIGRLVVEQKSTDFASWYATYEKSAQSTIDDFYAALDKIER